MSTSNVLFYDTLPALRVYWAKHRSLGRPTPDVDWEDLDVLIAALDALEEGIESARRHMYALNKAVADERDKTRSLQARLDAATVLIRQAMGERHTGIVTDRTGGVWINRRRCGSDLGTSIATCENCAPYRAWLAGDKEAGNE